jgi:hypothetical protein
MDRWVPLLPVLGCVAMMVVMVWMMRGRGQSGGQVSGMDSRTAAEIADLRAELAQLREQRPRTHPDGPTSQRR